MKAITNAAAALIFLTATRAGAAPPSAPDTQPGADEVWLFCTATGDHVSSNCRFGAAVSSEAARIKAGSILGYLDAHPFPLPDATKGAEVLVVVRLTVKEAADHKGYVITAPEGMFTPLSGLDVKDPLWIYSPFDHWTTWFMPDRAARMAVVGEASVRCKVTASGSLVDCWLQRAGPSGFGFGEAAMKMVQRARMQPLTASGQPVADRSISINILFDPKNLTKRCAMEEKYEKVCQFQ